ncbi:MAG: hypothetical protein ACUVRZ_07360 [Desulfobacca sp.]|uniref:hypothetical protein n=1 Tax=Desulfobacca sp. TaxID=2067990 RepID=UPI0040498F84
MKTITLECLRGVEAPARVAVQRQNGRHAVYFQVTSPRQLEPLCHQRPVEELPRLVTLLSPAHHLVAAQALDHLGEVTPPAMAQHMREGLRQALTYRHHLRKLYFLLLAWENPLADNDSLEFRRLPHKFPPRLLDDLWRQISLAQEAVSILGGRFDHPITGVAGGVSRFLREEHYPRLAAIASSCRDFALSLSDFLVSAVFPWGREEGWLDLDLPPLASLTLSSPDGQVVRRDAQGQEQEHFTAAAFLEKIGCHQEPWTYEAFAYFRDQGWQELEPTSVAHLFAVGPLARLNSGTAASTPAAAAEQERLSAALGPLPRQELAAAYWALLVELLQAGELMVKLYSPDNLTGPAPRQIPQRLGRETQATLESPAGLLFLQVRVNDRGLIEDLQLLDPATENNALRCLVAQQVVSTSLAANRSWEEIKKRLELSLLPW